MTRWSLLKKGCKVPPIFGDPGLLLPYVYHPKISLKKNNIQNDICFVPHFQARQKSEVTDLISLSVPDNLLFQILFSFLCTGPSDPFQVSEKKIGSQEFLKNIEFFALHSVY